LFKLRKALGGWIVGFGVFAKHKVLPAWLAWDAFGLKNGATSFPEMRARIERLRPSRPVREVEVGDYDIGCLMLSQPVFLKRQDWIVPPSDWPENAVQGSRYDLSQGEGARVWEEVERRAAGRGALEGAR